MDDFVLHPRLAEDSIFLADWPLSRLLLMNDARFPWLILVPRRKDATEIHDLRPEDCVALTGEICRASVVLKDISGAAKINVGALGNLVAQLHVHVVGRRPGDAAWPAPVWGNGDPLPYDDAARRNLVTRLVACLG